MDQNALEKLLTDLVSTTEGVVAEFKQNNSDPDLVGEKISALSNSANLHDQKSAYLVYGVEDGNNDIVGTTFVPSKEKVSNDIFEFWLSRKLSPKIDFTIHEFFVPRFTDRNF